MNLSGPAVDTWALLGIRSGSQAQLFQGIVQDMCIRAPRSPVHNLGDPGPIWLRSGPPELQAKIAACTDPIVAATFADCMKILAETWQPDVRHGRAADWRPVPR